MTILGPLNLASTAPFNASQMYAKNVSALLLHLLKDGQIRLDPDDEIIRETLVAHDGHVDHPKVREMLRVMQATVGAGRALEE